MQATAIGITIYLSSQKQACFTITSELTRSKHMVHCQSQASNDPPYDDQLQIIPYRHQTTYSMNPRPALDLADRELANGTAPCPKRAPVPTMFSTSQAKLHARLTQRPETRDNAATKRKNVLSLPPTASKNNKHLLLGLAPSRTKTHST